MVLGVRGTNGLRGGPVSQSELREQHHRAHGAIAKLLEDLEGMDLRKFVRNPNIQAPHFFETAEGWKESLRHAKRGLEEWCPGGGFFIDTKPK
jgi:hypothetical protein